METLINLLSERLGDNKELYKKLFCEVYFSKGRPVVMNLDDIRHSIPYTADAHLFKTSVHNGQRKLLLTEVRFLTECTKDKVYWCVYAGAAPSDHTGWLARLFPNVKFLLVDPNDFRVIEATPMVLHSKKQGSIDKRNIDELIRQALNSDKQIFIINDIFTDLLAESIHKQIPHDSLLFVSDIRTNYKANVKPDTIDIIWNLAQQYVWIRLMNPTFSMVKFRHPFYAEDEDVFEQKHETEPYSSTFKKAKELGIDFVDNYKSGKKLVYFDGIVQLQAFAPVSSTETRLIISDVKSIRDWGAPNEYEDKLFFYNNIERCFGRHVNAAVNKTYGFDCCNDCAIENLIWEMYIKKYESKPYLSVIEYVIESTRIIHNKSLRVNLHGTFCGELYKTREFIQKVREHNNTRKT